MSNDRLIVPTRDTLGKFDFKFLIANEDSVDWGKLCSFKEKRFTLQEIRLFGRSIAWNVYMINHELSEDELMLAAKYFNERNFQAISLFSRLPDAFIREHAAKLSWLSLLNNSKISEDTLFEMSQHWQSLDQDMVAAAIVNNTNIDLKSKRYERLALYLKLKD
jgi:hypothetical protein